MNAVVKKDQLPAIPSEPASVLSIIERVASNPATDIDKLERLLQMHKDMLAMQQRQEYDQAMSRAQSAMKRIEADANNPQTRSNYASYAALDRALRPIYSGQGFSLSFDTGDAPQPDTVRLLCTVAHSGGHREVKHIDMPADGKGAKGGDVMTKTHATGSAVTYGKRYLLGMIFNVAVGVDMDDDGNRAGGDDPEKDAIQDKIQLAETLTELKKVKPEISALVNPRAKSFLIGAYNARLHQLEGKP